MTEEYSRDYYAWTREQITLLHEGALTDLDTANLLTELSLLAGGVVSELDNRMTLLYEHLLKLAIASEHYPRDYVRAARGWQLTCREQRYRIERLLRRNPSLRSLLRDILIESSVVARLPVAHSFGIAVDELPATPLWTLQQVLDEDFWPEEGL